MKKILVRILAAVLVVGGLVAVLWPVDTWRLYDANWQPLAMTEAENYCAGKVLAENSFVNKKDDIIVDTCVETSDRGNVASVGSSQAWFCQGIRSVLPSFDDCLPVVQNYQIWGLQHGGYTLEWNDSNTYPQIVQYNITEAPRGDGRDDGNRNDNGRGFTGP
jgi:hypothetical protein